MYQHHYSFTRLSFAKDIPANWLGFTAIRQFRGKHIEIDVQNPDHVCKGVKLLTHNGQPLPGNLLPLELLEEKNKVVVVLG